jgi:hypothetical protein
VADGAPDASSPDPSSPPGEGPDRAARIARIARVLGARRYRQARRRLEGLRARAGDPVAAAFDRALPAAQLRDLFEYPRKRMSVAYLLWLLAGLLGAHRFYLDREGTAAAQFLTGGGFLLWWAADGFLVPSMVRAYNDEQAEREEEGRPPRALDFLETEEGGPGDGENTDPAASGRGRDPDAGPEGAAVGDREEPAGDADLPGTSPAWAEDRSAGRGRLAADLAVVGLAGLMLGAVSGEMGAWRAAAAVATIVLAVSFAPELSALRRLPGTSDLLRWAARLGLFYRYHDPGGPLSRLARPMVGPMVAPFRRRARAETHLYLELGGAFAVVFFVVDLVAFGGSALVAGAELTDPGELIELGSRWGAAALLTLINVYAFATPIGATLYEHALSGRSHRRVWLLGAAALGGIALGWLAA